MKAEEYTFHLHPLIWRALSADCNCEYKLWIDVHLSKPFRMILVDSIDEPEWFRDGIWVQGDTRVGSYAHIPSGLSKVDISKSEPYR